MPNIGIAAVGAAVVALSAPAAAQEWPARPLTMVVPFAAGGSPDILARILAPRLSELLGQQVIVENVGGAGGTTAAARIAKATPDGYQFILGNSGTHAITDTLYRHPPYRAAGDFAPVVLIAEFPIVLIARKDLPASDLREFTTHARKNQANMQFGSAGAGTTTHLACTLLNTAIGVTVTHLPYRGGGLVMQDLIAGRIDYSCPLTAIAIPQIAGATVKPIALLQKRRSPLLPDLASAHEQGLTDFDATSWHGFFLPKATPAAIVQKLNAATITTMDTPAVLARMNEIDASAVAPERRTASYLQAFVLSEIAKWAAPIRAAGLSVD
jgi:tripartite-type tricarboxylate transporter receptor subunit TctC